MTKARWRAATAARLPFDDSPQYLCRSQKMRLPCRQSNLAGRVKFVGFDTSPALIEALRKGEIDALVAQDPRRMGRETLTAAVHHLRGMPVAPLIDTGAVVVTRENVDRPEIQKILQLP